MNGHSTKQTSPGLELVLSKRHFLRKAIFIFIFALVFSPLGNLIAQYLPENLKMKTAQAAISFVSSTCQSSDDGVGTYTLTLPTTLENDLVVVAVGIGDNDNIDEDVGPNLVGTYGYTEVADLFSNDTQDTNLGVFWKVMGATPDTSYVLDSIGGNDASNVAVCMVFRGVDTTTPMDVVPTGATGLNIFNPDPPSIDHLNPAGVWTVIAGASGHTLGVGTHTFPTGYTTNAINRVHNDTSDMTVGMGYRSSGVSDPEDPGVMTHSGSNNTAFSWAAATLALRPAPNTIGIFTSCTTDGVTGCTDTGSNEFRVAVNGVLQSQTRTTVDGTSAAIAGVTQPSAGAIITVFIEGETASSSQGVAVFKYDGTESFPIVRIIEGTLTIGNWNLSTTITNADLAQYDSSVSGKRTFYDVDASNNLTLDLDNKVQGDTLLVYSGAAISTYQPEAGTTNTFSNLNNQDIITAGSSTLIASGSWDDNGTFTSGTSTVIMTGTGIVGDGSTYNNLTINSSGIVTASGSFTVQGILTSTAGTLSIPSGTTLTHSGSTLTLGGTISGAGTLKETASGFTFPTSGAGTMSAILLMDTANGNQTLSAMTYGGAVQIDNSGATAGRTVTLGTAGSQTLTFSSGLDIAESGTGSVELTGSTNNPTINITGSLACSTGTLNNITTGTGTWTASGGVNFTNCNTVTTTGSTIALTGGTLTSNGKTLNNINLSSGSITLADATHTIAGNLVLGGTITAGSSTITMTGTANTITGGSSTLANLTIDPSSTGTITLQTSSLTVSGTLTVAASDKFKINSGITLTLSGTGTPLVVSGTFEPDSGSTVQYTNSSATVTGTTFGNLTLGDGADTITLPSSGVFTIKGNLAITSGTTIASGSATVLFRAGTTKSITDSNAIKQNLGEIQVMASTSGNTLLTLGSDIKISSASIDSSQTLDANGANTLTIHGAGNVFSVNGIFVPQTGRVEYTTGGSANVSVASYNDLTLGGIGTYILPAADITVYGNMVIATGATVTKSTTNKITFSKGGGSSQSLTSNAINSDLGEIRISANAGNTTLTLGSDIKISSASIDSSQTLNANGSKILTITGAGNVFNASGSYGTFIPSTGAVVFTGNSATNIPTLDYYDLKIQPSANSITHTFLSGTASVSKTFTVGNGTNTGVIVTADTNGTGLDIASVSISANTTLVADNSSEFTISRHFINNGAFTHSSGTVTFEGPNTSSISGATTFNNFTSTAVGKKIKFQAGTTFVFAGNFTITGASGNTIKIESTASASQWFANFSVAQSGVTYTTIADSGCDVASADVTLDTTSSNGGGNDSACWIFPIVITFTQNDYEWFNNADGVQPGSSINGTENNQAEIASAGVIVRLRMNITIGNDNLSASSQQFKLQHALAPSGPWTDVGTGAWIFKNNTSPADQANISGALISTTNVLETYHESNPTNLNPNGATNGQNIEYDWSLDPANAAAGFVYYFQIVKSNGDALNSYDNYPAIRITVNVLRGGGGGVTSGGGSAGGSQQSGGGLGGGGGSENGGSGGGSQQGGGGSGGGGATP